MKNYEALVHGAAAFIDASPSNKVEELGGMQIYEQPIFGVADANDPLFITLKEAEVVGPAHLLPTEWLADAQTVISYFLPFSSAVREANYISGFPAVEWVYGRIEGEACSVLLRKFLVEQMQECGINVLAPSLDSRFAVVENKSNWSERHIAFIAGLGTFSLNKTIITKKGCAGRLGSLIVNKKFAVTQRPYQDIYEYCSWCGECIERCPSGAITPAGKNIQTCSDYIDTQIKPRFAPRYGCGKCQTTVQCENKLP